MCVTILRWCTSNIFWSIITINVLYQVKELGHHIKYHANTLGNKLYDVGKSVLADALDQGSDLLLGGAQGECFSRRCSVWKMSKFNTFKQPNASFSCCWCCSKSSSNRRYHWKERAWLQQDCHSGQWWYDPTCWGKIVDNVSSWSWWAGLGKLQCSNGCRLKKKLALATDKP